MARLPIFEQPEQEIVDDPHTETEMLMPTIARGTRDLAHQAARARGDDTELAGLANDLRDPLFVIKHELSVLDDRVTVNGRASFERIAHSAAVIDRLMSNALDLVAINEAGLDLHFERCDLVRLVHSTLARSISVQERRQIHVDVLEPTFVRVDVKRIERVLTNLIAYALQHGLEPIAIRLDTHAGYARVSLVDSGPGIPEAQARAVFDRTAQHRMSKGLDMFVTRKIVEAHLGRVGVTSETTSTFYFELPAIP